MKTIFPIIIFCCFSISLSAQTLTGKVIDEKNQPIEFVNVVLYSLPDSALITGTVTNVAGEFSLDKKGVKNAFLKLSFIGYQTQTVPAVSEQTIVLKDDGNVLGEVV